MNRQRFVALLVVALLAISAALYLAESRNGSVESHGTPLLPGLSGEIAGITEVTILKGSATPTVTLHKSAGLWTVAQRADYAADVLKLRKLMTSLSDAKVVEEKTANPASFALIGVEDPTQVAATGAEITLSSPTFKRSVIIGNAVGDGNFVRRGAENQSFMVEPAIAFEMEPRYWIESQLLDIPVARIQRIELKVADGAGYVLRRADTQHDKFLLDGIPRGRTALEGAALAPSASTLSNLSAQDVSPTSAVDFGGASQAIIELTDGNVITLSGKIVGDKHWIQVSASKDPALGARSAGRAFDIASYRYDAVFRPLESLLAPAAVPTGAKVPSPPTRKLPVSPLS